MELPGSQRRPHALLKPACSPHFWTDRLATVISYLALLSPPSPFQSFGTDSIPLLSYKVSKWT